MNQSYNLYNKNKLQKACKREPFLVYLFMFSSEVISYQDKLYIVVRTFPDHEDFPATEAKEYYNCDMVLRRQGKIYICRVIEEAQVIEEYGEV